MQKLRESVLIKKCFFPVLIFVSILAVFWRIFAGEIPVPYRMDYIRFLTQQIRVVEDIKAGFFPLWNPYILCGVPTVGEVMSNLFSPFLPLYFLCKDPIFIYISIMILEFFLIGFTFQLMMSSLFNIDRLSAYIAGIVFSLCGFMFWILNVSMRSIEDLLFIYPLTFLFYYKLRNEPRAKWAALIAATLALSYINCNGSILQYGYNIVFLTAFHFFCTIFCRKKIRKELLISVLFFLGIACAIGLSAFQFLPVYEAVKESTRFSGAVSYRPRQFFPTVFGFIYPDIWPQFSMVKFDLIQALKYGIAGYCGVPALICTLIGIFYHKDRKKVFFVFVAAAYVVIWPFYTAPSIQKLLPSFIKAGNHLFYSMYLYSFSIAVLAGLGCSVIRDNIASLKELFSSKKVFYRIILGVITVLLCIYTVSLTGLIITRIVLPKYIPVIKEKFIEKSLGSENLQRTPQFYAEKIEYLIGLYKKNCPLFIFSNTVKVFGLFLILLLIFNKKIIRRNIVLPGLAICIFFDSWSAANQYLEFFPASLCYPRTAEVSFLRKTAESDLFRTGIFFEDSNWFWEKNPDAGFNDFYRFNEDISKRLHENIIIRHGIQTIGAFTGLCPNRFYQYFSLLGKNRGLGSHGIFLSTLNSPLLDLANMQFALSPEKLNDNKFLEVLHGDYYTVYRNRDAYPRIFWVPQALFISSQHLLFNILKAGLFDFGSTVLISEIKPPDDTLVKSVQHPDNEGFVTIHEYTPNQIVASTNYTRDGWLVITDTYYPGWKAYIDGNPAEIYPAYHLFRTVPVKSGFHTVELRYFSDYMYRGIWISSISFVVITGLLLIEKILIKIHKGRN